MGDVLCIGATGMLAGCVRALVARSDRVITLGRSQRSFDTLAQSIPERDPDSDRTRLRFHRCDYRHTEQLESTLAQLDPHPTGAICWVHTPAPPVLDRVLKRFPAIDLLQVLGSSMDPGQYRHRTVQLGCVIDGDHPRWLTHKEISEGVFEAFISGAQASQIGVVEPGDARP